MACQRLCKAGAENGIEELGRFKVEPNVALSSIEHFENHPGPSYEQARGLLRNRRAGLSFENVLDELQNTILVVEETFSSLKVFQGGGRSPDLRTNFFVRIILNSFRPLPEGLEVSSKKSSLFYKVTSRMFDDAGIVVGDLRHAIKKVIDPDQ